MQGHVKSGEVTWQARVCHHAAATTRQLLLFISHTNKGTKERRNKRKKIAVKRELWSRFSGLLDYSPSPTEGLRAPGPTTEPTQ